MDAFGLQRTGGALQLPYGERAVIHKPSGVLIGLVGTVPSIAPFGQVSQFPAMARDFATPEVLNEVVNGLLAAPDRKATVTGYANKKLFNRDNKTLAADRARAVVTYLKSKGVPQTQIDEVNGGDTVTFPAVGTRDKTASTRRVEVVISSS
jgi:hypothetical protein